MTDNQKKLMNILREMFQFDQADLDFGIYRIMRMKRDEINRFIEEELPVQISDGLRELAGVNIAAEVAAIDKQIADTKAASLSDAIKTAAVAELEEKKKALAKSVDITAVEADVYNHLTNFFSRYYNDGDFISQRRYKDGVYAIPYEGEEVKLHWANADQYYVKTSEYFKDYAFKTMYGDTVRFKLIEVETERDNNKASEKRFFQIHVDKPFEVIGGVLHIYVEYKNGGRKNQAECIDEIVSAFAAVQNRPEYRPFSVILAMTDGKTLLERHLNRYTARNTFDYFIHKDLGKFLRRELDFYIKNDVIFLDDIDEQDEAKTKEYLTKAKVIRKIARKIITFLSQIEDFQKKLYLKKKFVVETNYCITLDRVPESMYPEIAANDAQCEEWVRLFAIDEIEGDLLKPAYSVPLTVEFLKANPFLVLDTAFFSAEFKERLIAGIDNLDEKLDGLLIHSENLQALNLMQEKYREKIDCIYIDPPYNTEDDREKGKFLYKDCFENSSWLAMMYQTTQLSYRCISNIGSFFASCDENELFNFTPMLMGLFGEKNFVENICWNKRIPKNDKGIGNIHEYILLFSKNKAQRKQVLENSSYVMRKEAINEIYELLEKMKLNRTPLHKAQEELKKFYKDQDFDRGITLYCELDRNYEPWGKINMSWPNAKTYGPRYTIINPLTGKPVPVPQRGWRWKEETFNDALNDGEEFILPDGSMMKGKIWFANDDLTQPSSITYLKDVEHFLLRSVISLKSDGSIILDNMGLGDAFDYPKPVNLIKTLIYSTRNKNTIVLDFFAGSGTTAHAVINLNREDGGSRKYILVEMGEYFNTVTKPRVEKVIYSEDWKDGKPVSRKGSSHAFKYLRLESYEDTLNNIVLRGGNYDLLGDAREGYMLSYMLGVEAAGSASLLNVEKLDKPFSYKMNITRNLESAERAVDLVETFNYLIGLTVEKSHASVSYDADFATGEYGAVTAALKEGKTYRFKAIEGMVPNGDKTLVIWREMTGDIEKDNAALDAYFLSIPNARSFKRIYVNCDNNLLNLRNNGESWQVVLIDEEMKKRMFENAE